MGVARKKSPCAVCHGKGEVERKRDTLIQGVQVAMIVPCPRCGRKKDGPHDVLLK